MKRLRILTWPIHGSYFNSLAQMDYDWYLPVKPGSPDGYGGRGGPSSTLREYVREVPADRVRDLDLDLVIYQSPRNVFEDASEILSDTQRKLPRIYLEHNVPRPHPTDTRHPIEDPHTLLVHVTHYNRLMWDNGRTPTTVIEHSVAIDPEARYVGDLARGISMVNEMKRRGRIAGLDVFLRAQQEVPLDTVGIKSEEVGGLGDIPYPKLHSHVARYRFLFSHMRYTSLPLALVEAMTMGMPVVALATTEVPVVIQDGETGYVSCDVGELIERMKHLLENPCEAQRLGRNAFQLASERFRMDRFINDWNRAFEQAMDLRSGDVVESVVTDTGRRS